VGSMGQGSTNVERGPQGRRGVSRERVTAPITTRTLLFVVLNTGPAYRTYAQNGRTKKEDHKKKKKNCSIGDCSKDSVGRGKSKKKVHRGGGKRDFKRKRIRPPRGREAEHQSKQEERRRPKNHLRKKS